MVLQRVENEFETVGYAITGTETRKISKSYLESLENCDTFLNKLNSAITGTFKAGDDSELESYADKSLEVINKDLAFLSFAIFDASNVEITSNGLVITTKKYSSDGSSLTCQEQAHTLDTIKPCINKELKIKQANIQGSLIVVEVEELGSDNPFTPIVEYQLLIKLVDKTVIHFNRVSDSKHGLLDLAYINGSIAIVNKKNRGILHGIVHANINESLDYIVETDIGEIAILSSTFKGKESLVYKVRMVYMAESKEEILLLGAFFTEGEYVSLLKKAVSGTLVVANGQTMLVNKVYDQANILKNMLRGSAS